MDIERPQTLIEKKDFTALNSLDYRKVFAAKLAEEEQKYKKLYKPFCTRCARLDYEDKIEQIAREQERTTGIIDYSSDAFKNITIDFSKYAGEQKFGLINESEIVEAVVIDGTKVQKQTGYYMNYKCKDRKCGVALQIPNAEYQKLTIKK